MHKLDKIKAFLQTRGYDLRKIKGQDLNDTNVISKALTKQEALDVIQFYYDWELPILGGDVFYLDPEGSINWTYDNWYFIKELEESDIEFFKRSIKVTKDYISNYYNDSFEDCTFLFDIVCAPPTSAGIDS